MESCWNCKFFTRTGGHGSYDWGYCGVINSSVESDDSCDKFVSKEEIKKVNPVKIEIVKRKSVTDSSKENFLVRVHDSGGELIDVTGFKEKNAAGRYAFEAEQFYKFFKED